MLNSVAIPYESFIYVKGEISKGIFKCVLLKNPVFLINLAKRFEISKEFYENHFNGSI